MELDDEQLEDADGQQVGAHEQVRAEALGADGGGVEESQHADEGAEAEEGGGDAANLTAALAGGAGGMSLAAQLGQLNHPMYSGQQMQGLQAQQQVQAMQQLGLMQNMVSAGGAAAASCRVFRLD